MTTIAQIKAAVADHYQLAPAELYGRRRHAYLARPRQLAMAMARDITGKSLPEIARAFGRDHTTMVHAIRQVERRMREDDSLRMDRMAIEAALVIHPLTFRHGGSGKCYAPAAASVEPMP